MTAQAIVGDGPIARARRLNRAHVAANRHRFVLLHAGVAAFEDSLVVFPGASESGKSTLVAGLVRAGWNYLSDELAMVDPATGELTPYRRRISIDPGAYHLFPELESYESGAEQWHVEPTDLSPVALDAGAPRVISHVVFNRFVQGAPTTLTPLSQADCLNKLIANSIELTMHGTLGFDVLCRLARTADGFTLESGVLDDQIAALRQLVGAE